VTQQIRPGPAGPDALAGAAWRKARASDANSGRVEIALLADGSVGEAGFGAGDCHVGPGYAGQAGASRKLWTLA
jgi:hypothetical protein